MTTLGFSFHKSGPSPLELHLRKKTSEAARRMERERERERCSVSLASGAAEIQHSQRLFGSAYLQYSHLHTHTLRHTHHKQRVQNNSRSN